MNTKQEHCIETDKSNFVLPALILLQAGTAQHQETASAYNFLLVVDGSGEEGVEYPSNIVGLLVLRHLGQLRAKDDRGQLATAWQNSWGLGEGTETEASPEGKERSGAFLALWCTIQGTSFCFILGGVLMKLAYFDGGS